MSKVKQGRVVGRARSRMLYQITALLVAVLIVLGLAVFFVVDGTLNRLIDEDKNDRIKSAAEIIVSGNDALLVYENARYKKYMTTHQGDWSLEEWHKAMQAKSVTDFQRYQQAGLQAAVESGLYDTPFLLVFSNEPSAYLPNPSIIASNGASLLYAEVPDYVIQAVEEGKSYIWMEDGIPELGLEGGYLITLHEIDLPANDASYTFAGVIPMQEQINSINEFYSHEKARVTWILAACVAGGIILVFLISFIVLRILIRRRITKPVDELAGKAGEIMQGNLDVEIEVQKGEEFEVLKQAFKEMLDALKKIVHRSEGKD